MRFYKITSCTNYRYSQLQSGCWGKPFSCSETSPIHNREGRVRTKRLAMQLVAGQNPARSKLLSMSGAYVLFAQHLFGTLSPICHLRNGQAGRPALLSIPTTL